VDVPKQDSIASPEFDQKNSKKIVRDFDEECPDLN
jgi:hypothetical protein